jgi:hypothetical protein
MLRLSAKSLPNTLFFCFQGQLLLVILSVFASSTAIADITALGRLSTLLAIFSAAFTNVLLPRFARCQDPDRLPRLYLLLVSATVFVLAPLVVLSWVFPEPLLWLLGDKYSELQAECGWVVTAGALGQVAGVMWGLNASKAWVHYVMPWFIPATLVVQAVSAYLLDLTKFHDVLVFSLLTAGALIPVYLVDAVRGLRNAKSHRDGGPA